MLRIWQVFQRILAGRCLENTCICNVPSHDYSILGPSATIFAQMPIPLDRDWQCARCDRNYSWTDLTWMEQHVWFQFQRHGPWPGSWIARGPWHRLDVKVCADCAEFVHRSYWRTTDGLVLGCSCYFISFESRGAHFYNTMAGG